MPEIIIAGVSASSNAKVSFWDAFMKEIASSNDMKKIHKALNNAMATLEAQRDDHEDTIQKHKATKKPDHYQYQRRNPSFLLICPGEAKRRLSLYQR